MIEEEIVVTRRPDLRESGIFELEEATRRVTEEQLSIKQSIQTYILKVKALEVLGISLKSFSIMKRLGESKSNKQNVGKNLELMGRYRIEEELFVIAEEHLQPIKKCI